MLRFLAFAIFVGVVSAQEPPLYQNYPNSDWNGVCDSGEVQSPIDLPTHMKAVIHAPIDYPNYFNGHFNKHYKGSLINNGNTVVWNINAMSHWHLHGGKEWRWRNPCIWYGPFGGLTFTHAYFLWKIEFHWGEPGNPTKGSEHTFDGIMSPLEMQFFHIEDRYINEDGKVMWNKARKSKHGIAILSILFYVDNSKPQNQEPLSDIDDKVWEFHWPGAHGGNGRKKRALNESMDMDEVEGKQLEHDHDLNIKSLQYALSQLKESEAETKETREPHMKRVKMTLNPGAFIRKVVRNGGDKTRSKRSTKPISTYWTYQGSLTTPSCDEAVTWVVFHRRLPIAQVQVNAFSSLYSNNYRPSRPIPDCDCSSKYNLMYLLHGPI